MEKNSVFNATVCLLGILILLIHIVNIALKKNKRKDEKCLFDFFLFTAIHFTTYLIFTFVKTVYTSNTYIISFYSLFYVMNNVEAYLLFRYMLGYVELEEKTRKILSLINISLFMVYIFLDLLNISTGIFFTAKGGVYLRSKTMIVSQGYQFVLFAIVFFVTVLNKKLNAREKTAFALYCFLPLVAIILQNVFKGYAIAYASIIVAIEVLFFFLNVQKSIDLANEEQKNKEAQIKLMLSQIQPHFIYNSLSAISTLIPIDPNKAQGALDDFTEYLRRNLASLTETRLIPFVDELKHIKSYVSLEKMRFNDRVNVIYDIQTVDFYLPPLSIQPLVENAIKHGILKKLEGGTLTLKTHERWDAYIVEVIDDGVGFCMEAIPFDENKHFGINNIKYRIENTGAGELSVKSEKGKGTHVTVVFHKKEIV